MVSVGIKTQNGNRAGRKAKGDMKRQKVTRNVILAIVILLVSMIVLTGCKGGGKGTTSTKTDNGSGIAALKSYVKSADPSKILRTAQDKMDNTNYVKAQIAYKFKYLDKEVSNRVYEDSMDCTIRKFPEGDQIQLMSASPDGTTYSELAYIVKTDDIDKEDGSNSLHNIKEEYSKFVSYDNDKTWEKIGTNELWGRKAIDSIRFEALAKAPGLEVDKGQTMIDEYYAIHLHGTLTWEEAQEFIGGLTEVYNIENAKRATEAKKITFDGYFYQDYRPYMFELTFEDTGDVDKDFTYSLWKVEAKYGPENLEKHLSINRQVKEQVLLKEREKQQEHEFQLGGIEIEVTTEAPSTEAEIETDSGAGLGETESKSKESSNIQESKQ